MEAETKYHTEDYVAAIFKLSIISSFIRSWVYLIYSFLCGFATFTVTCDIWKQHF